MFTSHHNITSTASAIVDSALSKTFAKSSLSQQAGTQAINLTVTLFQLRFSIKVLTIFLAWSRCLILRRNGWSGCFIAKLECCILPCWVKVAKRCICAAAEASRGQTGLYAKSQILMENVASGQC